jgi:hypothetical protein
MNYYLAFFRVGIHLPEDWDISGCPRRVFCLLVLVIFSFVHARADTKGDIITALDKGVLLSADVKSKIDQFTDPLKELSDSYSALGDAVAEGNHPAKPAAPYSAEDLADRLTSAASTLNGMSLLPVLAPGNYGVSLDDLRSCSTQDATIARLHDYSAAFDVEVAKGADTVAFLNAYVAAILSVDHDIQNLVHIFGVAAASTPGELDGYFSLDHWQDLSKVDHSLTELLDVARGQLARVTANQAAIQTQADSLRSNLTLIHPGSCVLVGNWSGHCTLVGLGLTSAGSLSMGDQAGQTATWTLVSTSIPANTVAVTGKTHLSMTMGHPTPANFQGDFNVQYTQFTGTEFGGNVRVSYQCKFSGSGH